MSAMEWAVWMVLALGAIGFCFGAYFRLGARYNAREDAEQFPLSSYEKDTEPWPAPR